MTKKEKKTVEDLVFSAFASGYETFPKTKDLGLDSQSDLDWECLYFWNESKLRADLGLEEMHGI